MESERLKACPFCGGAAEEVELDMGQCRAVRCKSCKAYGPAVYFGPGQEEPRKLAAELWNRRVLVWDNPTVEKPRSFCGWCCQPLPAEQDRCTESPSGRHWDFSTVL